MTNATPSLAQQIETVVTAFMADLPKADAQVVAGSFAQPSAPNATAEALTVGVIAPDFLPPDASGKTIRLYDRLPELEALGASLIAVSPETPDNSLTTVQKHRLGFDVLSDAGNRVARD